MKTIAYSFLALCLTVSPGLAQTYVTLSGSYSDYTLQSGTTYYISNSVILTGATIIEGGAVIKYAAGKSLTISDSIFCNTSPQRPAYFTAKDDDTVGDMIAGSSGSPFGYYAATALRLPAAGGSVLSHLRFRYARTAVAVGSLEDGVYPEDVLECLEFQHCDSGVAVTGPDGSQTESFVGGSQTSGIGGGGGGGGVHARGVELLNVLFSEGSQVITGRVAHVNVFWLTADQAAYVAYGSDVDVLVRESVLANVSHAGGGGAAISGSYNGYYHSTNAAFGTSPNYVTTNYPFRSFNGNDYYLTNGSPFVDAGGEMAMDAGLQNYTTQTNQLPDTGTVDLGYHYYASGKDSTGTDFWIGFMDIKNTTYLGFNDLSLCISSSLGTTGAVVIPYFGVTNAFSLSAGAMTNIPIDSDIMLSRYFSPVGTNGIHIMATEPVAVYAVDYSPYTSAAFTCYPTCLLGTDYCIMSRQSIVGEKSEFAIVATADNTTVTIMPSATAILQGDEEGTNYTIILQQGQTYQGLGNRFYSDVTGTRIISDQPVAVFAGNTATFVPAGVAAANSLAQEQLPVEDWGTNIVSLSFAGRQNGDSYRILAAYSNTVITVTGLVVTVDEDTYEVLSADYETVTTNLDAGQFFDIIIDGPAWFQASQPIQVAQFGNGWGFDQDLKPYSYEGDPCEILLPSTDRYLVTNVVYTPDYSNPDYPSALWFDENYLNLIVSQSATNGTYVDGSMVDSTNFIPIVASGYYGAKIVVTNGAHTVTSSQPVFVEIYGFGAADAYSYFGGIVK